MNQPKPDIKEQLNTFFSQYKKRVYPKGQIMVFAGDTSSSIYYIKSGKVSQYDITYRGDEVIVNILGPSAFFSMSWALSEVQNRYFYKAELETEVHIAPKEDVVAFIKKNPEITFDLLSRIYRGLDGVMARAVYLMSGTAKERVIHELILESKRFGESQSDGIYDLAIGEKELAARAGLARETVSREVKSLKDDRIISIGQHSITINDLKSLESMLSTKS